MIEWLYKESLPLYDYTGKKHYFERVCGMMDCTTHLHSGNMGDVITISITVIKV